MSFAEAAEYIAANNAYPNDHLGSLEVDGSASPITEENPITNCEACIDLDEGALDACIETGFVTCSDEPLGWQAFVPAIDIEDMPRPWVDQCSGADPLPLLSMSAPFQIAS